jgi:hypothetical protein
MNELSGGASSWPDFEEIKNLRLVLFPGVHFDKANVCSILPQFDNLQPNNCEQILPHKNKSNPPIRHTSRPSMFIASFKNRQKVSVAVS